MPLLGKNNSLLGKVSPKTCQNSFCNSPIFFHAKLLPLKLCEKLLGRRIQRCIQNPVEHLRWSILHKSLKTFNLELNLQKAPSYMFQWVLNTPQRCSLFHERKGLQ